ncbi:MAG: AraC family transcriptional regulator [Atopobiaceae bacterium]|nr:AraC family transcriptional regulator [Atopobiaceae bacterium]
MARRFLSPVSNSHRQVTEDRSIAQIAALLRFCDQSHFTQAFRHHTGVTPRKYRDANRR